MLRNYPLLSSFFYAPDDGAGDGAGGDGAAAGTDGAGGDAGTGASGGSGDESQLGDAGKRALDAERAARASAEKSARDAETERKKLADKLAEFENANKSENEKAIENARKEADEAARAEVSGKFEQRLLESNVLVRAAGKLADPHDAVQLIDLDVLKSEAGEGNEVEDKAIDAAIAALVKAKPYLATDAKSGAGSPDGGPRGNRPAQLTQADMKGMTPEQIVEAKAKGQFDGMLGRS